VVSLTGDAPDVGEEASTSGVGAEASTSGVGEAAVAAGVGGEVAVVLPGSPEGSEARWVVEATPTVRSLWQ